MAKKRIVKRRKKTTPKSIGLSPEDTQRADDAAASRLAQQVSADGGAVLASYREPFGGTPVLLGALPVDRVEPTPYQRDPSVPHVKRLMNVFETLGRFLDPIIAIRQDEAYWTPNGNHRLQALRKLGARTVTALLVPEPRAARLLAADDDVAAIIEKLKARGLTSPYLRSFVVARVNPIRFSKATEFDFDDVLDRMRRAAGKFKIDRVKQEDVVRAGG